MARRYYDRGERTVLAVKNHAIQLESLMAVEKVLDRGTRTAPRKPAGTVAAVTKAGGEATVSDGQKSKKAVQNSKKKGPEVASNQKGPSSAKSGPKTLQERNEAVRALMREAKVNGCFGCLSGQHSWDEKFSNYWENYFFCDKNQLKVKRRHFPFECHSIPAERNEVVHRAILHREKNGDPKK